MISQEKYNLIQAIAEVYKKMDEGFVLGSIGTALSALIINDYPENHVFFNKPDSGAIQEIIEKANDYAAELVKERKGLND
jgi:hypothetical protein